MASACTTTGAATRRIHRALVGLYALCSGKGFAYTLQATTCDVNGSDTTDTITLGFCQGGTFCTPADEVHVVPTSEEGIGGHLVSPIDCLECLQPIFGVPIDIGYDATTVVISNPGRDGWCLMELSFQGGPNLIGASGGVWLSSGFGENSGCFGGLYYADSAMPCQDSWRFFDLDGADDYTYDVKVTACEGTRSATIQASFCSTAWCSTEKGELVNATLTMNDVYGGQTNYEVALPFNPLAMKLLEVDNDWCVDAMTYNGFAILASSTSVTDFDDTDEDGNRTMIVSNIQHNGLAPTPSPTKAPSPAPTKSPTKSPTPRPTPLPTKSPTPAPTSSPTKPPTIQPTPAPTPAPTQTPTPAPTQSPVPAPSQWSIIAAWVTAITLLGVLFVTCSGLKKHCAAQDKRIMPSLRTLCAQGSFWSAMVVLAGLFVTLNIFNFASMWGIVSVWAGFVLWFVVLAWFVVFKTRSPGVVSFRGNP